ncbi:MAG: MBL fold metallo-hydrolase [Chloroflexi bacterium]|nr:MBL fold metallo-hydrolase [Chloroflexota bacterium]
MANIDEIVEGVYRIATFDDRTGMFFNQYLIEDEKATLVHTGAAPIFEGVLECISRVTDPAALAYAFISHFEADECGALPMLMSVAKNLVPVGSAVTARQLAGFGICTNTLVQNEDDVLSLGRRRLRFITYPSEMHLWDGLLAYEEADGVLFTSDLFIRRGRFDSAVVPADIAEVLDIANASIPSDEAREACLAKLRALDIAILALGHGPALDVR